MKDEYVISCNGDCKLPRCPDLAGLATITEFKCCCGKRWVPSIVEREMKTRAGSGHIIERGMMWAWVPK